MRLALRVALMGVLIEVFFFSFWTLDNKFNFFHLPTAEEAGKMGNYSQPAFRAWLEHANLVLCPPAVVTSFIGTDLGLAANAILASIAALLNGGLYFVFGLALTGIRRTILVRRAR